MTRVSQKVLIFTLPFFGEPLGGSTQYARDKSHD
jgi:hypothetical protein